MIKQQRCAFYCGTEQYNLLLPIEGVGQYILAAGWQHRLQDSRDIELYWCTRGKIRMHPSLGAYELSPNQAIFITGRQPLEHIALEEDTEYWWFSSVTPWWKTLVDAYALSDKPLNAGPCPVELFCRIEQLLYNPDSGSQYQASLLAMEIMHRALSPSEDYLKNQQLTAQFKILVEQSLADNNISVDFIAAKMGIHRSTLHRIIKRSIGCSPIEYIQAERIKLASRLLINTGWRIRVISDKCGFSNVNYFTKTIRRVLGKTPAQLRNEHA